MLIARLIADPAGLDTQLSSLSIALAAEGLAMAEAVMLENGGEVVEIEVVGDDMAALRGVLDTFFPHSDALVSREPFQLPHLFVSDMDSTMIGQECIDELADYAGLKPQIAAITERAMQGELDFPSALRERVALLAGLEESAIERCLAERIRPSPGGRTLVATLRHLGCRTVLVTGGFHHFANPVAGLLGFERVAANGLGVAGHRLTGELSGPIADSDTKLAVLREELAALGANAVSLATGDGANDIPMIEAATYGVAYHAKPRARAAANGWIDRGDLTSLLKLLGVPESAWMKD